MRRPAENLVLGGSWDLLGSKYGYSLNRGYKHHL